MQEIDKEFNRLSLNGLGNLQFTHSTPLVLSPQMGGYSMYYQINDSIDATTLKFMCGLPAMYKGYMFGKFSSFERNSRRRDLINFIRYISIIQTKKPTGATDEVAKLLSPLSDFEYLILLT